MTPPSSLLTDQSLTLTLQRKLLSLDLTAPVRPAVVEILAELCMGRDLDVAYVLQFDHTACMLRTLFQWSPDAQQGFPLNAPLTPLHRWVAALRSGAPLVVPDVRRIADQDGWPLPPHQDRRPASFLQVPILRGESLFGVMGVGVSARLRSWSDEDILQIALLTPMLAQISLPRLDILRLQASEARFQGFIEQINRAMVVVEPRRPIPVDAPLDEQVGELHNHGRIVVCNDEACAHFGLQRAALLGRTPAQLPPLHRWGLRAIARAGYQTVLEFEEGRQTLSLTAERLITNGHLTSLWVSIADVTAERQAAQQQEALGRRVQRIERLESLSKLAGGIAHDFNNQMMVIQGNAELIKLQADDAAPWMEDLDELQRAGRRVTEMTNKLLAFSLRHPLHTQPVEMNDLLASACPMLRRLLFKSTSLTLMPADQPCWSMVDPGQLEQVLINLVLNAREAMPNGGHLRLECTRTALSPSDPRLPPGSAAGPYLQIAVKDTGIGIAEDLQERIFEPFFTTHPFGEQTGLGLSFAYGILQKHGGDITVESTLGHGATFRILLPLSDDLIPAPVHIAAPAPGGDETILLAEDEPALRRIVAYSLMRAGYQVIEASNGQEALDQFRQRSDEIDLLLLDVIMPHLSGWEVAEQVRAIRPEVSIIFSSGYLGPRPPQIADAPMLLKPYTLEDLKQCLREVLSP